MDDRELLELAAKAAGMHKLTEWSDGIWDHDSPHYGYPALHEAGPGGACGSWNPLTDDGDCARMEAELLLRVTFHDGWVSVGHASFGAEEYGEFYSAHHDRNAARRRASTYAAAEIGRAM